MKGWLKIFSPFIVNKKKKKMPQKVYKSIKQTSFLFSIISFDFLWNKKRKIKLFPRAILKREEVEEMKTFFYIFIARCHVDIDTVFFLRLFKGKSWRGKLQEALTHIVVYIPMAKQSIIKSNNINLLIKDNWLFIEIWESKLLLIIACKQGH